MRGRENVERERDEYKGRNKQNFHGPESRGCGLRSQLPRTIYL